MPAFDPVRDAVLNSPISQSRPLPSPNVALPPYALQVSQSPSFASAGQPSTSNATASPSPTSRRPTDLSMLLNADDGQSSPTLHRRPSSSGANVASSLTFISPPAPSSGTPRSRAVHLSHILLPNPDDVHPPPSRTASPTVSPSLASTDILAPSLSRASAATTTGIILSPKLAHEKTDYNRRDSSSSSQSISTPRSPESGRAVSLNKSPAIIHPLPPKPHTTMAMHPERKRSDIPYAPRNRISAPTSILTPYTKEEVDMYRNLHSNPLRTKRKWEDISRDEFDSGSGPASKKHRGDVKLVVQHYNERPDVGVQQRQNSPIIGLKNFNNWVKSVLIAKFAHPALRGNGDSTSGKSPNSGKYLSVSGNSRGKVLDMGCGKGGDLNKWQKAKVREYIGVDIAGISVQQARSRYEQNSRTAKPGNQFTAAFYALDCYTNPLTQALPPGSLPPHGDYFDVVSMQFCMHYAFESVQKTRMMLENVTKWLRPGGVFVGTIPNDKQLLDRLDGIPQTAPPDDLSFGNSVYRIRFDDRQNRPLYGHRYWFFLQDAVDNVPEYIVRWEDFERLASEYGLEIRYRAEFHEVFQQHCEDAEFKRLLSTMRVINENGESAMDEDQWEAANVYIAFAFQMRMS